MSSGCIRRHRRRRRRMPIYAKTKTESRRGQACEKVGHVGGTLTFTRGGYARVLRTRPGSTMRSSILRRDTEVRCMPIEFAEDFQSEPATSASTLRLRAELALQMILFNNAIRVWERRTFRLYADIAINI